MKRLVWSAGVLATFTALVFTQPLAAQGVTSAAVVGRLTDEGGGPVPAAAVSLTNTATGQRYSARSSDDGRYFFENVQVGGPYTLEVHALGFAAAKVTDITLRLGQRLVQDLSVKRAALEVAAVTVTEQANPLLSPSRTGAQTFVSDSAIRRLPTISRNFTDFIQTVPQVVAAGVPGATLGGQNNRFNNIQIDGGVNNDVFGLAASGTPGGLDSVGVGIRQRTADTIATILSKLYGFDAGTWRAPTQGNPDKNIFGKLTAQLGTNSQLELSNNYVDATTDVLIRNSTATGLRHGDQLSNSGYFFGTTTNTSRANWTANVTSRYSNELLLGYQRIRDKRNLPNAVPLIFVGGDRAGTNIAAGADRFSQANSLDQDIYEVTDNLTFAQGSHLITVGTHNEIFHIVNGFFPASIGVWSFKNVDSLLAANPHRYQRALPGAVRPPAAVAHFQVRP